MYVGEGFPCFLALLLKSLYFMFCPKSASVSLSLYVFRSLSLFLQAIMPDILLHDYFGTIISRQCGG